MRVAHLCAPEENIMQSSRLHILLVYRVNVTLIDKERPECGYPQKPPDAMAPTTMAFWIHTLAQYEGRAQVLQCVRRLWREEGGQEMPAYTAEHFANVEA